jgi:hypothetical protein
MMKSGRLRGRERCLNRPLAEIFESPFHILDQKRTEIAGDPLPNENSLHDDVFAIRRQGIGRHLPAPAAETIRKVVQAEAGIGPGFDRPA